MTRERLIEIMNCHSDADTERLADAILAEMAGEWNAGLEAAAGVASKYADEQKAIQHGQWSFMYRAAMEICEAIRALRRPDAAPAAAARPVPQASSNVFMGLDQATALGLRGPAPTPELCRVRDAYLDNERRRDESERPVPQAGEVAELVEQLRKYWAYCSSGVAHIDRVTVKLAHDLLTAQAAEILAKRGRIAVLQGQLDGANAKLEKQAAEIERLKARCENLRSAMNSDPDVISLRAALAAKDAEIERLKAELRCAYARAAIAEIERAALAPAGKEVKP